MPEFTLLTPRHPIGATLDRLTTIDVSLVTGAPGTRVCGITVNHAEVRPGDLFAALPGRHSHGARHWRQAATAGAVAVLTDRAGLDLLAAGTSPWSAPVLLAADPRAELGRIAARVHGTDRHRPTLFGITGTNGKTTTVHLVDAMLEQLGMPAGHSSTADRRSGGAVVASRLTTPEAPELHALLARMNEDGVRAAAIEVSAQALTRNRVDEIVFDVVGFTNLSHDHRDDYSTPSEYLTAKLALFTPQHARRGVVLLDSAAGREIRDRSTIPVTTVSSVPGVSATWTVSVLEMSPAGTRFSLTGPDGRCLTTSVPLIGRHMAADAGLAIVMLVKAGFDFAEIAPALEDGIRVSVPGRTELVSGTTGPRVYTDFSHTPDSVAKTLSALRAVTAGRLIVVIGADGDKDPTKRRPMGSAAAEHADVVIVTDHHPRFEDPAVIRRALVQGALQVRPDQVVECPEPSIAIRTAIGMASEHDTILWVGPGQTDYRVVRDRDVPYSPRRDARIALHEAGWGGDVGA